MGRFSSGLAFLLMLSLGACRSRVAKPVPSPPAPISLSLVAVGDILMHQDVKRAAELEAYCGRLERILAQGGQLQAIQLYTVARPTPEPEARPLRRLVLDAIAASLRGRLPSLPVEVYYGPEEWA